MILRCTEFFGARCANAHSAATKNSKLAKGLNLMRNKSSIAGERTSSRRNLKNLVLVDENLGASHEHKLLS